MPCACVVYEAVQKDRAALLHDPPNLHEKYREQRVELERLRGKARAVVDVRDENDKCVTCRSPYLKHAAKCPFGELRAELLQEGGK